MKVHIMKIIYKLIKISSFVIRQYFLPNPFEIFKHGDIYNWVASGILVPITFFMVGFVYDSGSAPFIGSLLFFAFYLLNTYVLILCSVFSFSTIACIIIGIVYIALFSIIIKVRNFAYRGY